MVEKCLEDRPMKHRLFIAMHYMEIGGAESSLIGLLEALDPTIVDVDLFLYAHRGSLMSLIPKWVNVLPEISAYSCIESPMRDVIKKKQYGILFGRIIAKWKHFRYADSLSSEEKANDYSIFPLVTQSIRRFLPSLYHLGEYDLAISYMQPHDIVREKVWAKKYLAWIHTDYSTIHIDKKIEFKIWGSYDYISSISPACTDGFLRIFPELEDKIVEIENILPKSIILSKAEEPLTCDRYRHKGMLKLCSVGRICYPKNYDNIPRIAKELKLLFAERMRTNDSNIEYNDFCWIIVGPGDHSKIDLLSEGLGVKDNVVFLGPSDNPYPYIKHCDIYVHPSRYEGKSIVVREAQVLCKPVIITDYPTARSQIIDGVDGIIAEMDNKKIAEAIFILAFDAEKKLSLVDYLKEHDMSGQKEVEKIYALISEKTI